MGAPSDHFLLCVTFAVFVLANEGPLFMPMGLGGGIFGGGPPAAHQFGLPQQPPLAQLAPPLAQPPLAPIGQPPAGAAAAPGAAKTSLAPGGPVGLPAAKEITGGVFLAPRRPNHGVEGRPIVLRANHFQVRIPGGIIQHYEINVSPEKCPRRVNRYVRLLRQRSLTSRLYHPEGACLMINKWKQSGEMQICASIS